MSLPLLKLDVQISRIQLPAIALYAKSESPTRMTAPPDWASLRLSTFGVGDLEGEDSGFGLWEGSGELFGSGLPFGKTVLNFPLNRIAFVNGPSCKNSQSRTGPSFRRCANNVLPSGSRQGRWLRRRRCFLSRFSTCQLIRCMAAPQCRLP
jgi:hypothetical protein